MTATVSTASQSKLARGLVWTLKIVLALVFAAAALAKLSSQPMMVDEFGKIGFGQGFRIITAIIELAGVGLLIWPRTAFIGAIVLFGICAGALVAQVGPLHGDVIHVIVLGALTGLAAWLCRPGSLRSA